MSGSDRVPFRWGYLGRLARRDLAGHPLTTAAVLTALFAATWATLTAFGLAAGTRAVRLQRLQEDPVNRCLWYGNPGLARITPEVVARVRQAVTAALPPGGLEAIHRFSRTPDDWDFVAQDGATKTPIGRTLEPDDELLKSFPIADDPGRTRLNPEDEGIVVGPELLTMLGIDPAAVPDALWLNKRTGGRLSVPLLGVTARELPLFAEFVIGEQYEARLRAEDPDPALSEVRTGPIPPDWPAGPDLPESVRDMLTIYELDLPLIEPGDPPRWRLAKLPGADRPEPTLTEWRAMLKAIAAAMDEAGKGKNPTLAMVDLPRATTPPLRQAHNHLGVLVRDVEHVADADASARMALAQAFDPGHPERFAPLNRDAIVEVGTIERQAQQYVQAATLLAGVMAALALVMVVLIELIRGGSNQTELGMLRALGASRAQLFALGAIEGSTLGLVGMGLGLLAAWALGPTFASWLYEPSEATRGFVLGGATLIATMAGAPMIGVVGTTLGFLRGVWPKPGASLRAR